jgi:hypothetical protein
MSFEEANRTLSEFSTSKSFEDSFNDIPKLVDVFNVLQENGMIGFSLHDKKQVEAFSVFRKGIQPTWEDPQNAVGGHYEFNGRFLLEELDWLWENMIKHMIVDKFSNVTGIRVVDKSRISYNSLMYRFEVWTRLRDDTIAKHFISFMQDHIRFVWKSHDK